MLGFVELLYVQVSKVVAKYIYIDSRYLDLTSVIT